MTELMFLVFLICDYWYFLDQTFRIQSSFCNDCHDALIISIEIISIAYLNVHHVDQCCVIIGIGKSKPINLLKNADLSEKNESS